METRKPRSSPIIQRLLGNFIFVLFCSTLLIFAQAQQPMVLIDFEDFSAVGWPYYASPTLQILSASFSGGVVLISSEWGPQNEGNVYFTGSACNGCLPTITINFSQKVSNFSVLLLNGNYEAVTITVNDDQGGQQQITLAPYGDFNSVRTVSLPENNIRQVTISGNGVCLAIDNVQFRPSGPVLLDPVDSGFLSGPQVTTNPAILSQGGVIVQGVAADGVTQAVVRIPANYSGESLSVTVYDENGHTGSVANNGGLFAPGGSPQSAASTLPVTAVSTSNGPMAFVIYLSPVNFARGAYDYGTSTRAISLQVQSNDDPNYNLTANASVLRPPVVLVHGLWGSAGDWGAANFAIPIPGIFVQPVDYYYPLLQGVASTDPPYSSFFLDVNNIPTSALGFDHNAGVVDTQIRKSISDFRHSNNAAAVTADVVAHSMGGDIARTIALEPLFASNDTYGHGPIDKLITIGTPHLGSPLASDLLQDANACVRNFLAKNGNGSFITVTTSAGTINGAVGDLQGDGFGGSLSPALQLFNGVQPPFAMARVSAIEGSSNLAGLGCGFPCSAAELRDACGVLARDPLALALTPTGWPTLFGQDSDAVVPLLSQLNGGSGTPLPGVIHSPGMEDLDFNGPSELDPLSDVPGAVINLLNEPPNGSDFQ